MSLYLSSLELLARVHLGKEVEQWLGFSDEGEYTVIKWLYLAQAGPQQYTVTYVESFDEGDAEWDQVTEFSLLDPDAECTHAFDSVEQAVAFAEQTYGAAADRFISSGMLSAEYAKYWHDRNS